MPTDRVAFEQESTFFLVRTDVATPDNIKVELVEGDKLKRGVTTLDMETSDGRHLRIGVVHTKAHEHANPHVRVEERRHCPRIAKEHKLDALVGDR